MRCTFDMANANPDLSTLSPLSPEVIQNQATINIGTLRLASPPPPDNVRVGVFIAPHAHQSSVTHVLTLFFLHRYHWSCRSWKIHCRQGNFWRADCPIQERTGAQYHHQAWLCQCEDLPMRERKVPKAPVLPQLPIEQRAQPTMPSPWLHRKDEAIASCLIR